MNNKHFMIYYHYGAGTYVVTAPRAWAWDNQHHFPGRDFISDHPTVNEIEDFLISKFNFVRQKHDDDLITVISNLNPDPGFQL